MAEETQNPSRNVPNAMTTSVIGVSFFFSFCFSLLARLLMYYGIVIDLRSGLYRECNAPTYIPILPAV